MIVSILFLLIFNSVRVAKSEINIFDFPTLNLYDNYHECLGKYPGGDYCIIDTMIKPDLDSKLYKEILEYNKDVKKHFRRDMLTRGLCIEKCKKLIEIESENEKYLIEEFPRNVTVSFKLLEM